MKISVINFNRSGLFQYAFCLANEFAAQGNTVLFVTSKYNDLTLFPPHPNLSVLALDAPHQNYGKFLLKSLNLKTHLMFRSAIREFQPDAVLINDVYPWYLLHAKFLSRYPVFFLEHDPMLHEGEKRSFLIQRVQRSLRKVARQVIRHGEDLPHGVFPFYPAFQTGRIPEKNTVLFFGRILPYKGLDILIQAVEELPNVKLIIAGEGDISPYLPLIKHMEQYEIHNQYIEEREAPEFFERSQVIVLPYRSATQSGIIPIAYALSRPVIATNVGLLPSVVKEGETGFLIPHNDLAALKNSLQDALRDEVRIQEMGRKAKQFAEEQLHWDGVVKRMMNIIQNALKCFKS